MGYIDITPAWQLRLRWASFILAGMIALGVFLDAINNVLSLVTPRIACIGSAIIVFAWIVVGYVLKKFDVRWVTQDDQKSRILRLGDRIKGGLIGFIILLLISLVVDKPVEYNSSSQSDDILPKVIESFTRILEEKRVALEDKERQLLEMIKNYKQLQAQLAKYSNNDTLAVHAKRYLDNGDFVLAEAFLRKLKEAYKNEAVNYLQKQAQVAYELGQLKEIELKYQEAKKEYEEALKLQPEDLKYLDALGTLLFELGEYNDAKYNFEKALEIAEKRHIKQDSTIAQIYSNLGVAWHTLNDNKKAINFLEKALQIVKSMYGEKHLLAANCYNNIGGILNYSGEYKKAIQYLDKALIIQKSIYHNEVHSDIANSYHNIGYAWHHLSSYEKAIDSHNKALVIRKSLYIAFFS